MMALDILPVEILLEVFRQVTPFDLASLASTSRRFYEAIKQHESFLCQSIIQSRAMSLLSPIPSMAPRGPLPDLLVPWHRIKTTEALLPMLVTQQATTESLRILWAYQDAICNDDRQCSAAYHQALIQSTTLAQMESIVPSAVACGATLFEMTKNNSAIEALGSRPYDFIEVVLVNGVQQVANIVLKRTVDVSKELVQWNLPDRPAATLKLMEELVWKKKLAGSLPNVKAMTVV